MTSIVQDPYVVKFIVPYFPRKKKIIPIAYSHSEGKYGTIIIKYLLVYDVDRSIYPTTVFKIYSEKNNPRQNISCFYFFI